MLVLGTSMISRKMMIQNVAVFTRTNPGFVNLGQRIGKEKLFEYIDKFGFGSYNLLVIYLIKNKCESNNVLFWNKED